MARIQTILVPVDFAPPSDHALEFAMELAVSLGARLHVITAYELPIYGFPDGVALASAEIAAKLSNAAQKGLDEIVRRHRDARVEITQRVEMGDPRETILDVARDIRAHLIVMGTHGRKGLGRLLVGSVTEMVVRSSEIPVLTVH